jgi:hypothetical protein
MKKTEFETRQEEVTKKEEEKKYQQADKGMYAQLPYHESCLIAH